jgi:predicted transcriptional regulator
VASNVVKLKPETYERVKRLARESHTTMQEVVTRGVDALERQEFARAFQDDFARLREDRAAWDEEESERELWDATLSDGLQDDGSGPALGRRHCLGPR